MASKMKSDTFANVAAIGVEESAPNTLTMFKFAFPFSIMDKMALVINRMEYWLSTPAVMNGDGDSLFMGVIASSVITDPAVQSDPVLVDSVKWQRNDFGAAASGFLWHAPLVKDFSSMPGNGILVAPNPLYAFIKGGGLSAAASGWVKLFYTYMELSTDEYWQLVESRRIISN